MATVSVEGDELVFRTKLVNIDNYTLRLIQECTLIEPEGPRQNQEVPYRKGICNEVYKVPNVDSDIYCGRELNHEDPDHLGVNKEGVAFVWTAKKESKPSRCISETQIIAGRGAGTAIRCELNSPHFELKHKGYITEWDGNGDYQRVTYW